MEIEAWVKRNKIVEHKILFIFLAISFNICFGCIETVLLSTHNTCFGWALEKWFSIKHSYLEAGKDINKVENIEIAYKFYLAHCSVII